MERENPNTLCKLCGKNKYLTEHTPQHGLCVCVPFEPKQEDDNTFDVPNRTDAELKNMLMGKQENAGELPSEEEINNECYPNGLPNENGDRLYFKGQVKGATWMKGIASGIIERKDSNIQELLGKWSADRQVIRELYVELSELKSSQQSKEKEAVVSDEDKIIKLMVNSELNPKP